MELTEEIAEEAGMTVDREGFEAARKSSKNARASAVKGGSMGMQMKPFKTSQLKLSLATMRVNCRLSWWLS